MGFPTRAPSEARSARLPSAVPACKTQSVLSFADYQGQLAIGTYTNGLFIWDGERVTDHLTTDNVLKSEEVRAIATSEQYGVFLGS